MMNFMRDTALRLLRRYSFNTHLKIQHVGSLRRLRPTARAQSAASQVLSALWRYPLKPMAQQALLRPLDHPQALKNRAQVDDAIDCVLRLGLSAHKGAEKNWDFLAAFSAIVQRRRPSDVVLDFGSGQRSVILEWLHLYGYRHLHASDLSIKPRREGRIDYTSRTWSRPRILTPSLTSSLVYPSWNMAWTQRVCWPRSVAC